MRTTLLLDGTPCVDCGHAGWVLQISPKGRWVVHEHDDVPPCRLFHPRRPRPVKPPEPAGDTSRDMCRGR